MKVLIFHSRFGNEKLAAFIRFTVASTLTWPRKELCWSPRT